MTVPSPNRWEAFPGSQTSFLETRATEALYGGSAGCGKSQALLVDAARYYKRRGYKALLLRRTAKETKRSVADLAHQFYGATGLGMRYEHGVWSYPNGGTIVFDGINREQDIFKYNSTAWCYIGFDELSTFTEMQYIYMFSRLRGPIDIPWYVRSCTNPVGPHVEWVRKRWRYWIYRPHQRTDEFAGPYAREGQVLWFAPPGPGGEDRTVRVGTPGAVSRVYFPGLLADNPVLANSNYADILDQLDPVTRAQLRDGDWMMRAEPGTFFRRDWFRKRPPLAGGMMARVRFWDRAATEADASKKNNPDFTVGLLMALTVDGKFVIEDVRRARLEPGEVFNFIVTTAEDDELLTPRPMQRFEQEPGSSGKADVALYKRALAGMDVSSIRPTGDKVARARPVAAQAAPPASNVWIVQDDWNADFLEEYEAFPNKDMHDDQVDAGSGALAYLAPMARERRKREVNEEHAETEQRTFGPAYDAPRTDAVDVERSYQGGVSVGRRQQSRGGMDSPTRSGGF